MRVCRDEVEAPELFALGDGRDGLEAVSMVGSEGRSEACRRALTRAMAMCADSEKGGRKMQMGGRQLARAGGGCSLEC